MDEPEKDREAAARSVTGRPWKPGQSGNPAGRPKTPSEFREACRECTAEALAVLYAGLSATSETLRQAAANSLLDRGWGKPLQGVDVAMSEIPGRDRYFISTDAEMDAARVRALSVLLAKQNPQPLRPIAHVISDHEASPLSPCYTGEKRQ